MRVVIAIIFLSLSVVSCSKKAAEDLKSPCVGIEGSPCGPKKPVNKWIL